MTMRYSATNQKISWFSREDEAGALDLRPAFQRKPVWSDEQASYLIDTILGGQPFPEIYLRSTSDPDGHTRHEVVDGQQRIRSVLRFARNDLVLDGPDVTAKWVGKQLDDLSPAEKSAFWSYEVVVRDLGQASDPEIRDLFRRLNINPMPLTDQELRHAQYSGRFIKVMEHLAEDEWWVKHKIVTVPQVRRMADVEYITELFIAVIAGPQDKKKTLDDYYENYEKEMPDEAQWTTKFSSTRSLLTQILEPADIVEWSGKSDFYTLFLLFGGLVDKGVGLSDKRRKALRKRLMEFKSLVDQAKRQDNRATFPKPVTEYADAVSRAASDAGRREMRLRILEDQIKELVGSR